jgi:hypothetical protein
MQAVARVFGYSGYRGFAVMGKTPFFTPDCERTGRCKRRWKPERRFNLSGSPRPPASPLPPQMKYHRRCKRFENGLQTAGAFVTRLIPKRLQQSH